MGPDKRVGFARRCIRNALRQAFHVLACLAISYAHAAELSPATIDGTYEILICKNSCPATGDENVWVKGRLVLLPTSLGERDLERFNSSHVSRSRGQAPNGCFTLDTLQQDTYAGYAGIEKVGLTAWSVKDDALHFALYRSPDAGYKVTVQITNTGFDGTGVSWGAGVAAPVGVGPDKVVVRRIGAADTSQCGLQQGLENH